MFHTEEIYLAILSITMLVIILSMGIVLAIVNYKRKQGNYLREKKTMQLEFEKQLLQSQVEVQEATYSILAQELHDNVGQLLSSSKMLLGIAQRKLTNPPETLAIAEVTLAKAIIELRTLSKSLDKEWLEQFELLENLQTEIHRFKDNDNIKIGMHLAEKIPLSSEKQIILFRIIQEALQNIIKHAAAKNIFIDLRLENEKLLINITDDGHGINPNVTEGMGIKNMKQRTKLLGGQISWIQDLQGTSVNISLPIQTKEL